MADISFIDFIVVIISGIIVYMSLQNTPHSYINFVYLSFMLLLYAVALRSVVIKASRGEHSTPVEGARLTFWLGGILALSEIIHATLSFQQQNYVGGLIQSCLALVFGASALNQFDSFSVGGMPLLVKAAPPPK